MHPCLPCFWSNPIWHFVRSQYDISADPYIVSYIDSVPRLAMKRNIQPSNLSSSDEKERHMQELVDGWPDNRHGLLEHDGPLERREGTR